MKPPVWGGQGPYKDCRATDDDDDDEMEGMECIRLALDRVLWRTLVITEMKLRVEQESSNNFPATVSVSRMARSELVS
jgi:hypothetical protein